MAIRSPVLSARVWRMHRPIASFDTRSDWGLSLDKCMLLLFLYAPTAGVFPSIRHDPTVCSNCIVLPSATPTA
eukprot:842932-Rhodomonas_salina.1